MKVRLVKRQTIEDFSLKHARSKSSFSIWLTAIRHAEWDAPEDIQATFGSADLLGNGTNRVVFNIGGNNFRMICTYLVGRKEFHLFINWIGTHAEYDELCKNNEQYNLIFKRFHSLL